MKLLSFPDFGSAVADDVKMFNSRNVPGWPSLTDSEEKRKVSDIICVSGENREAFLRFEGCCREKSHRSFKMCTNLRKITVACGRWAHRKRSGRVGAFYQTAVHQETHLEWINYAFRDVSKDQNRIISRGCGLHSAGCGPKRTHVYLPHEKARRRDLELKCVCVVQSEVQLGTYTWGRLQASHLVS